MRRLRPSDFDVNDHVTIEESLLRPLRPIRQPARSAKGTGQTWLGGPIQRPAPGRAAGQVRARKIRLGRYPGFRETGEGVRCETFWVIGRRRSQCAGIALETAWGWALPVINQLISA